MKKYAVLAGVLACLCVMLCAAAAIAEDDALPENVVLYYFYDNLCASCDATEAFDEIVSRELEGLYELYPYEIRQVNVYSETGKTQYGEVLESLGVDKDTVSLPLLVAGGRVFQGDETIEKNLKEALLVAGEDLFVNGQVYNPTQRKTGEALFEGYEASPDAVTVIYFYRIVCEECNAVKPFVDALPRTVARDGEEVPVDVIRINTRSGNNGDRVAAFFDAYDVADDDRMVPIVFTKDAYFAGHDAITQGLLQALEASETGFVFPCGE